MKKLLLLITLTVLLLSACGGINSAATSTPTAAASPTVVENGRAQAAVEDNADALASQAIVEKWILAYQKRDANALMSVWSDQIVWYHCSDLDVLVAYTQGIAKDLGCVRYKLESLKSYVPSDFANPEFKVEISSYLISRSGKTAVIHAIYADKTQGYSTATPSLAILELQDGKIVNEWWYY